jgi:hypothetical protein
VVVAVAEDVTRSFPSEAVARLNGPATGCLSNRNRTGLRKPVRFRTNFPPSKAIASDCASTEFKVDVMFPGPV